MKKNLRLIFFGSSNFTLPLLECLKNNFILQAIVTNSHTLPPKDFAKKLNFPFFTPENSAELLLLKEKLSAFSPDLFIVADFGLLIPEKIFNLPKFNSLNIHFSKLPKYRGPSPVQYTILNGDDFAAVSILFITKELDQGDILFQEEVKLLGNETSESLYKKLFAMSADFLPKVIKKYINKEITPIKQNSQDATFTKKLSRNDGFIPWEVLLDAMKGKSLTQELSENWPLTKILTPPFSLLHTTYYILQSLRAFTPWPGLWTEITFPAIPGIKGPKFRESPIHKKRLKILKAHLFPSLQGQPLQMSTEQPKTKLILDQVQLEGKKPVTWKQFLDGYPQLHSFLNI